MTQSWHSRPHLTPSSWISFQVRAERYRKPQTVLEATHIALADSLPGGTVDVALAGCTCCVIIIRAGVAYACNIGASAARGRRAGWRLLPAFSHHQDHHHHHPCRRLEGNCNL